MEQGSYEEKADEGAVRKQCDRKKKMIWREFLKRNKENAEGNAEESEEEKAKKLKEEFEKIRQKAGLSCRKRGIKNDVRYQGAAELTLDCGWSEFVKKDDDRKMKQSRVSSVLEVNCGKKQAAV